MHRIAIAAAALLIAGTAAARERPDPVLDRLAATPVTCDTAADCEAKWSRALIWVLNNADYRLQAQTDTMIQTYGPFHYPLPKGTAFTVLKLPLGDGRYLIELRGECISAPYCGRSLRDRKAQFVRELMGDSVLATAVAAPQQ